MEINLSMAMTQSRSISLENPVPEVVSATAPATDNYSTMLNSFDNSSSVKNTRSNFSDHDNDDAFAQVDFLSLDDRITQHQLMMQQFLYDLPLMPPLLYALF